MQHPRKRLFFFLTAFLLMLAFTACSDKKGPQSPSRDKTAVDTKSFVIALLPEQNVFEQKKRYKALADYLSRATGMNVKTKLLDSYDAVYGEMSNDKVDAAVFGSLSYVVTDSKMPLVPLARPYLDDGISTYRGLIIVRKDSGITEDVKTWRGKRIALVHKSTTAGYIFPRWYLHKNGIRDFEGYFRKVLYAGSHDSAIFSVLKNDADIGCASDDIFNDLFEKNQLVRERLKAVTSSPRVPLNVLGIKQSADPELIKKLKDALLGMDKTHEGRAALSSLGAVRFIETKNSEFAPISEMLEALGMKPADFTLDIIGRPGKTTASKESPKE